LKTLLPQSDSFVKLVVVDNGHQNITIDHPKVEVIVNKENLGVSGSWNQILNHFADAKEVDYVLMLNDDITLAKDQLEKIRKFISKNTSKKMIVGPFYWAVWAMSIDFLPTIAYTSKKYFDEGFFPAYYEDNDFHRRVSLLDDSLYMGAGDTFQPEIMDNSMTKKKGMPQGKKGAKGSAVYYTAKWGGPPGKERFHRPHNQKVSTEALKKLKEVFVLYGKTVQIEDTVRSIQQFYQSPEIVVFTNADVTLPGIRVEKHDTYMTGAIWRGYEMYPDKDYFYFFNESIVLKKPLDFTKHNDVSSIAHFGAGFDGPDQSNWLKENFKNSQCVKLVDTRGWTGVYGSMIACQRTVLDRLKNIRFNEMIPTDMVGSQSMERGWGIGLKAIAAESTSVCGSIYDCLKRPDTNNIIFNISGNGGE